jgi:signal transduction histidine kinase
MNPEPAMPARQTAESRGRHCAGNRRKSAKPLRLPPAERERLRRALHDGLGQLLTSLSFVAASLCQKLNSKALPEAAEAGEIVALTAQAISETQALVADEAPRG